MGIVRPRVVAPSQTLAVICHAKGRRVFFSGKMPPLGYQNANTTPSVGQPAGLNERR